MTLSKRIFFNILHRWFALLLYDIGNTWRWRASNMQDALFKDRGGSIQDYWGRNQSDQRGIWFIQTPKCSPLWQNIQCLKQGSSRSAIVRLPQSERKTP